MKERVNKDEEEEEEEENGGWVFGTGNNGESHVNEFAEAWIQSHCLEQNSF